MAEKQSPNDVLTAYDDLLKKCNRFERKGKNMPYTSANGHMFSLINKAGELGIRFSKEVQEKYFLEFDTSFLISHGAKMKVYVLITDKMLANDKLMLRLLNESYDYVMSLPTK